MSTKRTNLTVLLAVLLLGILLAMPTAAANNGNNGDAIPGQYILTLTSNVNPAAAARDMAQAHGLDVRHVYTAALNGFAATVPEGRLNALRNDPRVVSIAQDRYVHITGSPSASSTQELPTGIDRIDGELSSTASGDGAGSVDVDVAIIDTGIAADHTDLNVAGGYNCTNGPTRNWDDGNGHGTHVAGTVAALDDASGVVGVAPGARLWAVRVLNAAGSGSWSDVICGVDWVTRNADTIEVANMSLGGGGSEPTGDGCNTGDSLHDAICNSVAAGVTYAVAAGNDYEDAANSVPAAYDEVITVSALSDFDGKSGGAGTETCRSDEDDTFANFSNFGADVDIIAPGVCILSTWNDGGYNTISGTSMASPHVAGAAALYLANNPGSSPDQVKQALQNSGTTDWDNSDDGDNTKEPLLNVSGY